MSNGVKKIKGSKNVNRDANSWSIKKRWFLGVAVFLILSFIPMFFGAGLSIIYANKIFPGVKIGIIDVSSMTRQQALDILNLIDKDLQENGIQFATEKKEVMVNPIVISTSPDLAQKLIFVDWQQTVENAYAIGRSSNLTNNFFIRFWTATLNNQVDIVYQIDKDRLIDHLQTSFVDQEKPPVNAQLEIKNGKATVLGEKSGYVFDYAKAVEDLIEDIENVKFEKINLELAFAEPEIKKAFTGSAVNSLNDILELDEITLVDGDRSWVLDKSKLISWLEFQKVGKEIVIGVNQELVFEFLEGIAEIINIETKDAKLEFAGERVVEFQSSQDGRSLNLEQTYKLLNAQVMLVDNAELSLVVDVDLAQVATGDLNDLGIKELLGRGTSNFKGSPANRRHNIDTGVASLNGLLIKPGEEFSVMSALGEIDGENGYLRELVIKGDRTIPEYGGGLCQIGSTTFRAVLWSGLPVTARRNHSYRVAYYEPAGMDATLYDPVPDMKFLNDTGNHILFIAKVVGDELHFEFYGTSDGRKVTIEPNPPAVYNIVDPGPPRFIETEDLPPGVKKKVESAHSGADTYFKYTVEYPDGRIEEEEFYSHYVPWRETWLIGKDPNASSTEAVQ